MAAAMAGLLAAIVALPVIAIEAGCRPATPPVAPLPGLSQDPQRALARTWLTYPEWHIVYSAESLGAHLAAGRAPSGYAYGGDVVGFWRSFCAINRVTAGLPGTSDAKLMIYTIGISFSAEMAVKALWERSIGFVAERVGGWHSAEDAAGARIQQRYAAFLHETPWYLFPFGDALAELWRAEGPGAPLRRAERRIALSSEYGVKALYAKALGAASGTMAPDARTMRIVVTAAPPRIRALDPRLRVLRPVPGGTLVEAPRYAQFTDLALKLAAARVPIADIAGNRTIFVTVRAPTGFAAPHALLAMPLADRPGWTRFGVTLPVPALTRWLAAAQARGAEVEHVYDY